MQTKATKHVFFKVVGLICHLVNEGLALAKNSSAICICVFVYMYGLIYSPKSFLLSCIWLGDCKWKRKMCVKVGIFYSHFTYIFPFPFQISQPNTTLEDSQISFSFPNAIPIIWLCLEDYIILRFSHIDIMVESALR